MDEKNNYYVGIPQMVDLNLIPPNRSKKQLESLIDMVFQTQIPRDGLFVRASARGLPIGVLEEGYGALAVFDSLRLEIDSKLDPHHPTHRATHAL
jgi:hypothetical protein